MAPTLKASTIAALKTGISQFSPQMRTAAKYVVDHPSPFGLDSIRETARKAKVSTYIFVKLAKSLGFESYEDFRQPFRQALVSGASVPSDPSWMSAQLHSSPSGKVYSEAASNAFSIVSQSLERQNLQELEAIADMLISAKTVYLTAVRSSYAIVYYLHYVGRMALPALELIPRHRNSAIDDLNDAKAGDVLIAITVTPYSRETIEACAFAKKKGVSLLLITDSEVVSASLAPEHTLVASMHSSHHFGCFSGMMAVVELLIAFLMQRGGDAALARIKSYEALRVEHNAFWMAQEKH